MAPTMTELETRVAALETAARRGGERFDALSARMTRVVGGAVVLLLAPSLTGLWWLAQLGARHDALEASVATHEQAPAHAGLAATMGRVEQHLVDIDRRLAGLEGED